MTSSRLLIGFSAICLALIAAWPAGWARDRAGDAIAASTSVSAPDFVGIDHIGELYQQPVRISRIVNG